MSKLFCVSDASALPFGDETIDCSVTSPPYFGVRDYGLGLGQLGLEPKIADYLSNMVACLAEVRRVLKADGTLWLNIGDTYNTRAPIRNGPHQGGLHDETKAAKRSWSEWSALGLARYSSRTGSGLKEKDLIGVPWRLAIALVDDGWYLRSEVIWSKPYGTPENARDRPSRTHETIFLLAKSRRYKLKKTADVRKTVWEIAPGGGSGPAVYPPEIPRRCIEASTDEGDIVLDPFAGSGTTARVAHSMGRVGVGCDLSSEWWVE